MLFLCKFFNTVLGRLQLLLIKITYLFHNTVTFYKKLFTLVFSSKCTDLLKILFMQHLYHLYDRIPLLFIVPVVHWLVDQTDSFRKLDVFSSDVLGIHTLYKIGSTRPIFTRTFSDAANVLKQMSQGSDSPHFGHL